MVTPGGGHSEEDIPALVKQAQARHPEVPIVYAWPFDASKTAQFLAEQIDQVNEQMNEELTRL
jgi:sirohydrochlorin ferrochelatase